MNTASEVLEDTADERPEPAMGSEYMDTRRYLAREKVTKPPAHGSNDSDFGQEQLRTE